MTPLVYSLCVRLVYHFLYLAAFIFSVLFFCFFYFFFFHIFLFFFFFFSSRRRHTRYIGDWSSDVCSSDLLDRPAPQGPAGGPPADFRSRRAALQAPPKKSACAASALP